MWKLPWNNDPTKHKCPRRRGFKSCPTHHWSETILEIRHQHTSILLSNRILTNQQTSILNLGRDAYFEYTSWYFKVVTLFIRNLFRVRLSYVLLIRSNYCRKIFTDYLCKKILCLQFLKWIPWRATWELLQLMFPHYF
jgi:hypothetical protein